MPTQKWQPQHEIEEKVCYDLTKDSQYTNSFRTKDSKGRNTRAGRGGGFKLKVSSPLKRPHAAKGREGERSETVVPEAID